MEEEKSEFSEYVVRINRIAKVVKGGRRFSLNALVVVGDKKGKVGCGQGKGKEVANAIQKATKKARGNMVNVIMEKDTIPFAVEGKFCSARVLLKPASRGTGIIAGAAVRSVVEGVGIHDILTKSLGSDNVVNIVKATFDALSQLRSKKEVEKLRGVVI